MPRNSRAFPIDNKSCMSADVFAQNFWLQQLREGWSFVKCVPRLSSNTCALEELSFSSARTEIRTQSGKLALRDESSVNGVRNQHRFGRFREPTVVPNIPAGKSGIGERLECGAHILA